MVTSELGRSLIALSAAVLMSIVATLFSGFSEDPELTRTRIEASEKFLREHPVATSAELDARFGRPAELLPETYRPFHQDVYLAFKSSAMWLVLFALISLLVTRPRLPEVLVVGGLAGFSMYMFAGLQPTIALSLAVMAYTAFWYAFPKVRRAKTKGNVEGGN